MGKIYQVVVHGPKGQKMAIDLCENEADMQKITVRQLKEKIAKRLGETAEMENIQLIFADKRLEDDNRRLSEYGVQDRSVIMMVLRLPGGLNAQHRPSSLLLHGS